MHVNSSVVIMSCVVLGGLGSGCKPREVVLCPGDSVVITSTDGPGLAIVATGATRREYRLPNGRRIDVELSPRTERWFGALGIYRPVSVGDTHLVLQEAVQHFSSEDEAREWMQRWSQREPPGSQSAVSATGLFVEWFYSERKPGQSGPANILKVDMYQILINRTAPRDLGIGLDRVLQKTVQQSCAGRQLEAGYMPSSSERRGDRQFTGRALDIMRERGFDAQEVEKTIESGRAHRTGGNTFYRIEGSQTVRQVEVDQSGRIIYVE